MLTARLHVSAPTHRIVQYGPLLATEWGTGGSVGDLDGLAAVEREMIEEFGAIDLLTVLYADRFESPEQDMRRRAAALMEEFGPHLRRQAYVIDGGGFRGAALRTFLGGLSLFTRSPVPTKTFATLEGACGWLSLEDPRLGGPAAMFDELVTSLGLDPLGIRPAPPRVRRSAPTRDLS